MTLLFWFLLVTMLAGQLGGVALAPGVTIYLHDVALGVFLCYGFFTLRFRFSSLLKPQIAFVAAAVISLLLGIGRFTAPQLFQSSLYLVRWAAYASLVWVVLASSLSSMLILYGLYGVSVGLATIGIVQYVLYPDLRNLMYLGWDPHYQRLFSTLLDPNFTGILLVMGILLGFGLLSQRKKRPGWLVASLAVLVVSLLFTYSRSSFLALLAGMVVWAALTKGWRLIVGLAILFVVALLLVQKSGEGQNLLRVTSTVARIGNASSAMSLFSQQPVVGHGFDTLRFVQCPAAGCIGEGGSVSRAASGVDSSLLFVLATTGIVGFTGFFWLMVWIASLGMHALKKSDTHWLGASFLAIGTALLVHSLFVNSLFYPWVLLWMWIFLGAFLKLTKVDK